VYLAVTESWRGGEPERVEVFENHPEILCKWLQPGGAWLSTAVSIAAATGGDIEAIRPACSLCSAAIASSGCFSVGISFSQERQ
jgi:hypothetical protein